MKLSSWFTKSNIEWLWNLVRPTFYNKLTLWVVAAGLAMMSTPLWVEPFLAYLNQKAGWNIKITPDTDHGMTLVIWGLIFNLLSQILEFGRRWMTDMEMKNKKSHDVRVAQKLEPFFAASPLIDILDYMTTTTSYEPDSWIELHQLRRELLKIESKMLCPAPESAREKLSSKLEEFGSFVAINFVIPRHRSASERPYLHPDFNSDMSHVDDAGRRFFDKKYDELCNLADEVKIAFTHYRMTLKNELYI